MEFVPGRILVVRLGALGDVVLTSPAMGALRKAYPEAEIHYLVDRRWAEVLAGDPRIHRVHTFDRSRGIGENLRDLRGVGFDGILDLHSRPRTRWLAWRLPARRKLTWHKRPWGDHLPVRLGLRPYRARMHIAQRYHQAVERLVGRSLPREPLTMSVTPAQAERAAKLLAESGLDPDIRPTAIIPGAMWATKRWSTDRFGEVAQRLTQLGHRVVVLGSPDEAEWTGRVASAAKGAVDLGGRTDLGTLIGVLARCSVVLANDSGPMHIARALGTPTAAIFGSTDPNQFDFSGHRLLHHPVACSPCHFYGRSRCPRGHLECLEMITVDQVATATGELLRQSSR